MALSASLAGGLARIPGLQAGDAFGIYTTAKIHETYSCHWPLAVRLLFFLSKATAVTWEGKATEAGSSWGGWERLFVRDEEGFRWASSSQGIARTRRV